MDVVSRRPGRRHAAGVASVLLAGILVSGCAGAPSNVVTTGTLPPTAVPSSTDATPATSASPTHAASTSAAPTKAPVLEIRSVSNFRDVAGAGLALPDGGRMATGVVYRSAKLATVSRADLDRLSKAGFGLVIDLRTNAVAARSPDPTVRGAEHRLVNVYAVSATPPARFRTVAAATAHMRQLNIDFVAKPAQRARIKEALELVADSDEPVLVHCTEGKDRTGWISAMLQFVAGADRDQVMAEYLKSNDYRAEIIKSAYASTRASRGVTAAQVERALLRVEADYLDAGLAELDRRYGDVDTYLTEGLGLSTATIEKLRARLVA